MLHKITQITNNEIKESLNRLICDPHTHTLAHIKLGDIGVTGSLHDAMVSNINRVSRNGRFFSHLVAILAPFYETDSVGMCMYTRSLNNSEKKYIRLGRSFFIVFSPLRKFNLYCTYSTLSSLLLRTHTLQTNVDAYLSQCLSFSFN